MTLNVSQIHKYLRFGSEFNERSIFDAKNYNRDSNQINA